MSFIKSEDSKKWINALVAIFSGIVGFVIYKFALQLSVWFDLEAKIAGYASITQDRAGQAKIRFLRLHLKLCHNFSKVDCNNRAFGQMVIRNSCS